MQVVQPEIPTGRMRTSEAWKLSPAVWTLFSAVVVLLVVVFYDGLNVMVSQWNHKQEYSHGFLIPAIALFLLWQKNDLLRQTEFRGSWAGAMIVAMGLLIFLLGELSTLYILVQYAFLIVLGGFVLSFAGWSGLRITRIPMLYLIFMIPLPNFIYNNLSLQLQLLSSRLGVEFIRYCDISVFLEGNVIDLGAYKLQVVEACNGLRYLFPFMSLAFLSAYIFEGAFWKKAVIFISSIPISVLMNSLRIGIIGVLVEYQGTAAAEGFVHDFEGWAVFMVCMGILVFEMWILAKVGKSKKSLSEVFKLTFPSPAPAGTIFSERRTPTSAKASLVLLIITVSISLFVDKPTEVFPDRLSFSQFPISIGQWRANLNRLDNNVAKILKLDDYYLADYSNRLGDRVNFYVAYYNSQSKGRSIHSPRSCLPGGGWQVTNLKPMLIENGKGKTIEVARALIEKADAKQLVYFWTQQRGKILNNEFLVKWHLFWDKLTRQRSDGALVRMVTSISPAEDIEQANRRLIRFGGLVTPLLANYIPD